MLIPPTPEQLSKAQEAAALESAFAACSLVEQLGVVLRDLEEFSQQLSFSQRSECETLIMTRLRSLLRAMDEGEISYKGIESKSLSSMGRSKIERLKLGGEIIRLRRRENLSVSEIVDRLNESLGEGLKVSVNSVRVFIRAYDAQSPVEKARIERSSIFDTVTQIEDLAAMIYRQLARLEGTDAENHVKYVSELRKVITDARTLMNSVSQQRQIEEIKSALIAVFAEMEPSKVEAFMVRIKAIGVTGFGASKAISTRSERLIDSETFV